jgi:thiamine-phosphate pyrophosphorylase
VHVVQVRERDLDGGPLVRLVARCVAAVESTRTRILVNDRLDVALAAGAHGVHLRGDSLPAARVRQVVAPGFLVGRSVHSVAEAAAAGGQGGLDYLIFGTVFASASKPGSEGRGAAALADVVAATALPVLAIGGLTALTAPGAARAGAAGVAAIGLFADGPQDSLAEAVAAVRHAFDTSGTVT